MKDIKARHLIHSRNRFKHAHDNVQKQEEVCSDMRNNKTINYSSNETTKLLDGELKKYLKVPPSNNESITDSFEESENDFENCECEDIGEMYDEAYDSDEYDEKTSFEKYYPLLSIAVISIITITLVCTLCFPTVFWKVLFLIEVIALCGYCIYANLPQAEEENDGEEKAVQVIIDKIKNGFEFIHPETSKRSLNELIHKETVLELKDLLDYIKNTEEFEEQGYIPETKVLLIGEAGSGKDSVIKAFSKDSELPIVRVHASRFFESKAIFENLFSLANYIDYILEIDSLEMFCSSVTSSESISPEILLDKLNAYLDAYPNVILFATCENALAFSTSTTLSKFFKKVIVIDPLNFNQRLELLKTFSAKYPVVEKINYENLAKCCIGFSVGEIKDMVNTAMEMAHKDNRKELTQSDFFNAYDTIRFGTSHSKHTEEYQRLVAVHESGHALVSYLLSGNKAVLRVISASHGSAGGLTQNFLDENKGILTEEELLNEVCVLYAGRCAEKLVFDKYSTGASSDIEQATALISSMIQRYGMSPEIGPVNVAPKMAYLAIVEESLETRNLISKERIRIAKECEAKTMTLLYENRDKLDKLSDYLVTHESITGEEMVELLKDE